MVDQVLKRSRTILSALPFASYNLLVSGFSQSHPHPHSHCQSWGWRRTVENGRKLEFGWAFCARGMMIV